MTETTIELVDIINEPDKDIFEIKRKQVELLQQAIDAKIAENRPAD